MIVDRQFSLNRLFSLANPCIAGACREPLFAGNMKSMRPKLSAMCAEIVDRQFGAKSLFNRGKLETIDG